MNRQRIYCCVLTVILFLAVSVGGSILTARQEQPKAAPKPPAEAPAAKKAPAPPFAPAAGAEAGPRDAFAKIRKAEAAIEKMFAEYDLTPHHLPTIPDNPPPHEGAMINYPVVIEPPDLVLIEVLEALPGRPISGERLVRYDGMVSLGFYGEVHIAGLTLTQAKVKILQHLRRFLNDELLGLYDVEAEEAGERPEDLNARPPIDRPQGQPHDKDPFQLDQGEKPKAAAARPHAEHSGYRIRSIRQGKDVRSYYGRYRSGPTYRVLGHLQEQDPKKGDEPRQAIKIPIQAGGQATVTIEVQSAEKKEGLGAEMQAGPPGSAPPWAPGPVKHPQDSDRIFLDITAHNSKNYYVEGDVGVPGHLPFTGHETVLDALDQASGLLPTAEPKDIRLVRPGATANRRRSTRLISRRSGNGVTSRPTTSSFPATA